MELNKKQTKEINEKIDFWINENYKDYFEKVKEEYDIFKAISFKDFSKRIKEIILNESETNDNHTPTLLNDDFFYTSELNDKLEHFKEELNEKETEELLNFDIENFYKEDFYNDDDYYKECLNTIFNHSITEKLKNSYSSYFINISEYDTKLINIIDIKDYDKNEYERYFDEFENALYELDINEVLTLYLHESHYKVFSWFCDTKEIDNNNRTLEKEIKKDIKTELEKRLRQNKKEIVNNKNEVVILTKNFNEHIKRKENYSLVLKNDNDEIKVFLKL